MIWFIEELVSNVAGGKATGLKTLKTQGLSVPDAFVLIHPQKDQLDDDLIQHYLDILGSGPKAVRSSAMSEDGKHASFAGQFETFLDLNSFSEIKQAIVQCIEATDLPRVQAYSGQLLTEADLRISVIIQNMVDAKVAGVVFTVNPVNHRRDKIVVNAVAGKGEAMVSGLQNATHYELYRSGSNIAREVIKNGDLLSKEQLEEILKGALHAEVNASQPVDMEWAIDHTGDLHWLQIRPVTTLQEEHYNELDTVKGSSQDVWTLCNIGEMMPGVATPLTCSVSAEAIDYGMTALADSVGAFDLRNRRGKQYIQMFYNRLFINMSNLMDYPKNIWLNKAQDVQFSICGKVFPGLQTPPLSPWHTRVFNFVKQMRHTLRAGRHLKELVRLAGTFRIEAGEGLTDLYANLGNARHQLGRGFELHLSTSAQSGVLYSTFMRIMTGDKRRPDARDHHIATLLLLNIPDIESADAIKSIERFSALIYNHPPFAQRFTVAGTEEALRLLREDAPAEIREQYRAFNERHGHRCVRESELREKTWAEEPLQIIGVIQKRVIARNYHPYQNESSTKSIKLPADISLLKRCILKALIPSARKAVARRETSKAFSIKMVDDMRKGYRLLAQRMVNEGLLDDTDQVYFLTHEELGLLIHDHSHAWKSKAGRRRELLPDTDALIFDDVCYGIPEPLEEEPVLELSEGQLKGIPVSSGIAEGRARIINSLEEATQLKEGEIMVASFTDIGWTPYFSIISGLITEIGSPLSHGAVVAREYGIPAVVGAKGARKFLQNGDLVRVDGKKGLVEKLGNK